MPYEIDDSEPDGWRHVPFPGDAPEMDAQSRAYREMTPADAVTDQQIAAFTAWFHPPMDRAVHPSEVLLLPEDHERGRWDAGRIDPRPGA